MAPRSKHGIYENVYEVVGLVGREEKGAKDIHDENATLCSNPSKWEDLATDRGCFISRTNCFVTFLYFSIAFVFYFSSRFSSIYFFIINCILFLRHCCKLIRFYPLRDNFFSYNSRQPIEIQLWTNSQWINRGLHGSPRSRVNGRLFTAIHSQARNTFARWSPFDALESINVAYVNRVQVKRGV